MKTSRYLLAVAVLATATACREDPSEDIGAAVGASSETEAVAPPSVTDDATEDTAVVPPDTEQPVTPPPSVEPPFEPKPVMDIDGLPMPDLSSSHDYEAYLAAQPLHYTRVTSPMGNVRGQDNTPFDNPVTNAGAALGRIIFYDVRLSANSTMSCASCHAQAHGFTDPDTFSVGFEGKLTGRHSMGLSNAAYYSNGKFFWDERAGSLEEQVLMPIQDSVEMGMNLFDLEVKLGMTSFYPSLFDQAFGDEAITSDRISFALAQFIRSMVSYQSKYDQAFVAGSWNAPDFAAVFTEQEQLGHKLFAGFPDGEHTSLGCVACHQTASHAMDQAHVNGLVTSSETDQGASGGFFKSPSLRNISVGAPYMHDGRLATLEDVVEFYNSGIQQHPNLSPDLTTSGRVGGRPIQLGLSDEEKAALVAFLGTLTDDVLLTDPMFSDPYTLMTTEE
ncbi:c-type cytochrome [Photobacterium japonica]|uniref:cytochrome-c peroxidase n=1 Tax=Photobacterium japonica TaxID=2910235 RepID=UPI003D142340